MRVLRLYDRHLKVMAALLILILTALPTALVASDCTVVYSTGETRECTATEEWGQCLSAAYQSYEDCREIFDGVLGWFGCQLALLADNTACTIESGADRIIRR